ncbi:GGDEF domain-containing protein [Vibrio pectenicida]|uniref:diguanylate cyclase n=1 Tax=Vibrio pectenicida TaxID=62763 RepID=A0A427U3B7_9VIBR|nr:GGDEF domain-containing protein [Vibrio pectenicida]RSD31184.1 GGDEF domain-containing protein [Vibrio pectenicida]
MRSNLLSSQASLEQNVLKITSFFLAAIGTGFTITNFFLWDLPKFGLIDSIYSLACIYIFLSIQYGRHRPWHSVLLIAGLTAILTYSLAFAGGYSVLVFWALCFPALYHIFFNRFAASLATLVFYITAVFILASYPPLVNSTAYTLFNFTIPYFLIWAISFVHEDVQTKIRTELSNAALLDPLTGAKNRLALENDTANNHEFIRDHFLIHFDLDHFKQVNDTHGHAAGDEVLKAVSHSITHFLGKESLYRVGGEEFCVIFSSDNIEQALEMANEVRSGLSKTAIPISENSLYVTLSGGLSKLIVKDGRVAIDDTMKETDIALYQAKNQGRNQIVAVSD